MNNQRQIILTDSLERELLQAELDHQNNFPLEGVAEAFKHGAAQTLAKIAGLFRFVRHTEAKAA